MINANDYRNTYGDILIDHGGYNYLRSSLNFDAKTLSSLSNYC